MGVTVRNAKTVSQFTIYNYITITSTTFQFSITRVVWFLFCSWVLVQYGMLPIGSWMMKRRGTEWYEQSSCP
jgi:membrane-associated PAP2 superfamily phosphatase